MEFRWDPAKADENRKKHGVAFEEALTIFADPLARIFDDPDHSREEMREIIVGHFRQAATAARLLHGASDKRLADQRSEGYQARATGL